jgi:nucleoside-diphosphate-sugar epimerase
VGRPRDARTANALLIRRAAEASAPKARIAYFSTLSVHARFQAAGSPPSRSAYGVEKLRCERDARSAARRFGKPTWILRLGHVSGELQGIHRELQGLVTAGPVAVPDLGRRASNVAHTVTVADAVLRVAAGSDPPGTYDLLSIPTWTWQEVLADEAARAGVPLHLLPADGDGAPSGLLRAAASRVLGAPRTREVALSLIAHLPEAFNLRVQSQYFRRRAAAEIASLRARPASHAAFTFPPMEARSLPSLTPTVRLLQEGRDRIPPPLPGPIRAS